jgi:hypothetical protein
MLPKKSFGNSNEGTMAMAFMTSSFEVRIGEHAQKLLVMMPLP